MLKLINNKLKGFALLEFWIVTGIVILALTLSLIDVVRVNQVPDVQTNINNISGGPTHFSLTYSSSFLPIIFNYFVIYICYLLLCFYVAPEFEKKEAGEKRSTVFVFLLIAISMLLGLINIYFAILLAIKLLSILFTRNRKNMANALNYEAALLTAIWIFIAVGTNFLSMTGVFKVGIVLIVPAVIIIYLHAVYIILPKLSLKKYPFLTFFGRMFLLSILSGIVLAVITYLLAQKTTFFAVTIFSNDFVLNTSIPYDDTPVIGIGTFFIQLFIAMPVSWFTFKSRQIKIAEEIKTLKTELGQSDASLNLLKSQINPHFMFNALNTLYGTALQENAGRTGEGIQKLGDMMRFMLHENMKDKIALARDIEYLNSYILLQKLRTSSSKDIVITTEVEHTANNLQIAPMLLIPFVENAFKHGISLINHSFIKISLQVTGDTLYFDVHNTIHLKQDHDPEKGQSGIGLENVKQRLLLLYPEKHELIIRETGKDFFVHLTVQLETEQ
jgi:two-component system LytT family sensor kinase